MLLSDIQKLARQGESLTLEFKKSTAQLHGAFETLCGFLNGKGGTVLIGVTDRGKIVGQEVSDATQKDIATEIRRLEPLSLIDIKYIPVDEDSALKVIALKVFPGEQGPYMYDGRAFQRIETTTLKMSQTFYHQLIIEKDQLENPWEKSFAQGYEMKDLDHDEIHRTLDLAMRINRIPDSAHQDNVEAILSNFELLKEGKLLNAAIALFAKKINLSYGQCGLRLARFIGNNKLKGFMDHNEIEGNAFLLLDEADRFLKRHLPISGTFEADNFQRKDTPALPPLAVREALINMVCHREYSFDAPTSSLAIYDDRVEIWNYGTLPKGVTFEDLKKPHSSKLRNKLIANVFYKRGLIEKWGSGILKMIELCKEQDLPEPEFIEHTGGVEVVFRFKASIGPSQIEDQKRELSKRKSLTLRQKEILEILSDLEKKSLKEILLKMNASISERTLRKDLTILRDLNLLGFYGRGRHAKWFIQFSK